MYRIEGFFLFILFYRGVEMPFESNFVRNKPDTSFLYLYRLFRFKINVCHLMPFLNSFLRSKTDAGFVH